MDDQRFDDGIKNKVGNYEDPRYDQAALAALHHQMAATFVVPWYSLYRTELLVGSGFLFSTLIILCSQWMMVTHTTETLNEKITSLQTQQAEIEKLQNQITVLKSSPPDTVRIIEIREQPSSDYTSLLYRIRLLEAQAANKNVATNEADTEFTPEPGQDFSTDSKNVFGLSESSTTSTSSYRNTFSSRLSLRATERESLRAKPDNETKLTQSTSQNLSAKTLRDLENHYQKGIGIRIGPTAEVSKGLNNAGTGQIGVTYGVLADFILSPSLSLEAGAKYSHRIYEIDKTSELATFQLPGMDASLGTLKTIDVDSWVFEIPLNLKYRYPVSVKTHWLGGIGYSTFIYGQQLFEYEYAIDSNPSASINSDHRYKNATVYPGSVNFSLGVSNVLKNKKILETSLYYQQGVGKMGLERNSINYLGVRGVYWFTVR